MLKLNNGLVRNSDFLRNIRLFVYLVMLCHLGFFSTHLLGLDYSKSKDPHLQAYVTIKWKLITTWFNLLLGPYLVMSIYCDWNCLKLNGNSKYVKLMDKTKNYLFNNILFPVTVFCDIFFWCIYFKDRKLIMPPSADEFITIWDQHNMHTVSLLFVFFDIICVPRKRPQHMRSGLITLTGFLTIYSFVCFHSALHQEYVYPGINMYPRYKIAIFVVFIYIGHVFYYTCQWVIVDMIWSKKIKCTRN